MNSKIIIKPNIEKALNNFLDNQQSLREASTTFLNTLGYHSGLVGSDEIDKPRYDRIKEAAEKTANPCEKLRIKDWEPFSQILQVTDAEINAQLTDESPRFESKAINTELRSSYMFIAMPLAGDTYTRTQLSNITRFMGMRIPQPFMMVFRYSDVVTLAIINRRPNLRNTTKQVLEKVTLIKDINLDSSKRKRAHIDILSELHLQLLIARRDVTNFDTLHDAWEIILNTEALNKRFYHELEAWYEWATETCKFPDHQNKTQVIRMVTRLLFVWFLKEKKLIPSDIFNEEVQVYLKNFESETSDYYQAILQNLFFATLNTPIDKRVFSRRNRGDTRNANKYRYADLLQNGEAFLEHLKQVPFVNGGLFDSLDSFEGQRAGGVRIDCFTDWENHRRKLHVPTKLFFEKDNGIFEIFSRYKFTIEENTPVDQEVALDPELLGQVFENLLGVYNPESETAARKTTGSYYTPRQIVNYMVDEVLIAYFLQKVKPYDNDRNYLEDRLRLNLEDLLAYESQGKTGETADHLIHEDEIESLIQTIDELEILDPAVGSGAFPIGILNKLVLILKKLDPKNEYWKQRQIEQAEKIPDSQSREAALTGIEEVFSKANQYNNYGRKLYLIQNCIYGADIQPIAVTIAKLRFFISLIIEQESNNNRDANYGIRPLPNLETKLVAANTLIGINKGAQQLLLETDPIKEKREEIERIRYKYFSENLRSEKLKYIKQEKACREELTKLLIGEQERWMTDRKNKISEQVSKFQTKQARMEVREKLEKTYVVQKAKLSAHFREANRIAHWNPYDQNAVADFFDPEWMFGIADGFDITTGNPPYVRADAGGDDPILRQQSKKMRKEIKDSKQYETLYEKWDLYIPFIERSYKLLKPSGFTTLIVSDAYCHAKYALKSQEWFLNKSKILRLDFLGKIQIFDAAVKNVIYLFQHTNGSDNKPERRVHVGEFGKVQILSTDEQQKLTHRAFFPEDATAQQFTIPTITLDNICYISVGMVVHADEKKAEGEFGLKDVVSNEKDGLHPKPFVEGKYLARWLPDTHKWLEWGTARAPALFRRRTFPELYEVEEKLISISMGAGVEKLRIVYDNQKLYHNHSAWSFVLWHDLAGVSNRSIQKQTRYRDEKQNPNLPKREDLEKTSRRFSMKFLIGVMNSNCARDFLLANRRSNLNLYPDDWKQLPIPNVPPEQQTPIIELVDKILAAKPKGLERKVIRLEKKLDKLVSALYGVEDEE